MFPVVGYSQITDPTGGTTNNCDGINEFNCDKVVADYKEFENSQVQAIIDGKLIDNFEEFYQNPDHDLLFSAPVLTSPVCDANVESSLGFNESRDFFAQFQVLDITAANFAFRHFHAIDSKHVASMLDVSFPFVTLVMLPPGVPAGTSGTFRLTGQQVVKKKAGQWKIEATSLHNVTTFDLP